jgi:hypothetical protein
MIKISDSHSHSILKDDKKYTWLTKRLWTLAKDLTPFEFDISSFQGFDEDCWFGNHHQPTLKAVLDHVNRIQAADLKYPIILSENGLVMDGIHRICRAKLEGRTSLLAVRFEKNPAPDKVVAI